MSLNLFFDIPKEEEKKEEEENPMTFISLDSLDSLQINPFVDAGTYILLGMHIDYGYFNDAKKQDQVEHVLKDRWSRNIDKEEFEKYFSDHNISPDKFNLN